MLCFGGILVFVNWLLLGLLPLEAVSCIVDWEFCDGTWWCFGRWQFWGRQPCRWSGFHPQAWEHWFRVGGFLLLHMRWSMGSWVVALGNCLCLLDVNGYGIALEWWRLLRIFIFWISPTLEWCFENLHPNLMVNPASAPFFSPSFWIFFLYVPIFCVLNCYVSIRNVVTWSC